MSEPINIAVVSGGFDPLHIGHVKLINAAAKYGRVQILLNSDAWLIRKKGAFFMPWCERALILGSLRVVSSVHAVDDSDETVVAGLRFMRETNPQNYNMTFCNGGDRESDNTPEAEFCVLAGIALAYNVGGNKVQSSSELLNKYKCRNGKYRLEIS